MPYYAWSYNCVSYDNLSNSHIQYAGSVSTCQRDNIKSSLLESPINHKPARAMYISCHTRKITIALKLIPLLHFL